MKYHLFRYLGDWYCGACAEDILNKRLNDPDRSEMDPAEDPVLHSFHQSYKFNYTAQCENCHCFLKTALTVSAIEHILMPMALGWRDLGHKQYEELCNTYGLTDRDVLTYKMAKILDK